MKTLVPTLDKRTSYNRRLEGMKSLRRRHEPHWSEIRDFIAPDAYEDPAAQQANDGARRDSAIVNNTPTLALEIAVSGLFNGTCDPTEKWLGLEAADPELNKLHNVRVYCEQCEDIVLGELARSNFYKQVPEDFTSLLGFGTCATVMEEVFNGEALINFSSMPLGSYYIANNHERKVETIARDMRMTAAQMVEKFGDKCSDDVKESYRNEQHQKDFQVVHIVHKNPSHNPMNDALSYDKAFRSCYYEPAAKDDAKGDRMLEESGFDVFPVACARWRTLGNNPWGFGPGRNAVGDSRALQAMEVDSATAVEMQVKPPLNVPRGMQGMEVSLIPGSLNYSIDQAGDQGIRPLLEVDHDISHARQAINEHESRIDAAFYNNLFLMIASDDGGKMTAREVMERVREKRLALTPILRVTEEYHKPIVAFMFDVCGRRGRLPEPPEELRGQRIKAVFRSVLAAAAEIERSQASRSSVMHAAEIARLTGDNSVLDVVNFDKHIREDFRRNGAGTDSLHSPEEVEAERAARAEEQAKAAQAERTNLAAQTAKTLSETNTTEPNALTEIVAGLEQ